MELVLAFVWWMIEVSNLYFQAMNGPGGAVAGMTNTGGGFGDQGDEMVSGLSSIQNQVGILHHI